MTAAARGRNIRLVGGGELVGAFADRGLLDELVLALHRSPSARARRCRRDG
ncbi:hypothetical protein [Streptomyces sp. NPDC026673]|uniref:hypothetical protein n=1 Tax=Streptomyces sp. NPDC026673 TaxID=3155724 RepID=UPI0033EE85D7